MRAVRLPLLLLAVLALAAPALAAFPADRPNDPKYAQENPECIDGMQYELFASIPGCTPGASDPEDASGMSVEKAW